MSPAPDRLRHAPLVAQPCASMAPKEERGPSPHEQHLSTLPVHHRLVRNALSRSASATARARSRRTPPTRACGRPPPTRWPRGAPAFRAKSASGHAVPRQCTLCRCSERCRCARRALRLRPHDLRRGEHEGLLPEAQQLSLAHDDLFGDAQDCRRKRRMPDRPPLHTARPRRRRSAWASRLSATWSLGKSFAEDLPP